MKNTATQLDGNRYTGDFKDRVTGETCILAKYKIGRNMYALQQRMVEINVNAGPEPRFFAMEYVGAKKWFCRTGGDIVGHIRGFASEGEAMAQIEKAAMGRAIRKVA